MGTFKSSKIINGSPSLIPQVGPDIMNYFLSENYDVNGDSLMSGGYDISVSKGNLFKAVLGMKTALKIVIRPQGDQIVVEAGVGIFGQQAIPAVISMLFFWPVLITQIWGIIQQSQLDEKVIEIAEESVRRHGQTTSGPLNAQPSGKRFCTKCGTSNIEGANYCRQCGSNL
ncbi:MAG: zinc ribbon domain-containing protein [Mangrovibacterium sp.]